MTHQGTLVTMCAPLGFGRFLTIEFDPSEPVDFAPLADLSVARVSQQSAPLRLKPLRESGAVAPLLHSATMLSLERRSSSPKGGFLDVGKKTQKTAREELTETLEALANRASELASIDSVLAPVRLEEEAIKSRIVATHEIRNGVVFLNLDRKGDRAPLFEKLSAISLKWGKIKSDRARVNSHVKSLDRQADHLRRLISKETKKRGAV